MLATQLSLFGPGRGGKRRGAGRKPKGQRRSTPHAKRPKVTRHVPLHLTLRVRPGRPSLRETRAHRALKRCFADARDRFGFRLVEYSIQSNHVHVIAEADDNRALGRGMQGLCRRIACALQKLWSMEGGVFDGRYHLELLTTPTQVRNALRYVIHNCVRHGFRYRGEPDPLSSGAWFEGWSDREPKRRPRRRPTADARSWLLRIGWKRLGRLSATLAHG